MAHSFNVFYLFPLQTGVSLLPTLLFVEEDMSTRYSKSLTLKFKTILYIYILLCGIYLPKKRKKNIPNIFVRSLGFLENTVVFGSSKSQILVELIRSECIYLEAKHKFSKNCSEMTGQYKVVMVRHGESEWNLKNQFTGWYDSKLSETGKKESIACGEAIKKSGLKFDVAHTSVLLRAHETLCPILDIIQQKDIPIFQTWRLNERHYGGLTGLNKAETAAKYGEEQVKIWRRSYDTPPPPMEPNHPFYDCIVNDPRYADGPKKEEFPMFESLKLTIQRTLPYWNDVIIPHLKEGKRVLIVAHGNSLRGIVKHLDNMSEEAIMTLNLPTGIPFVYELDENFKPVVSMKFLGDEETVKKAMEAVAAQGKAK